MKQFYMCPRSLAIVSRVVPSVYVAVDNVDDLHREFVAKGIPIDTGPVDQSWGTREMYVKDADLNSIRFTQDLD